jgi:hypothetical protein
MKSIGVYEAKTQLPRPRPGGARGTHHHHSARGPGGLDRPGGEPAAAADRARGRGPSGVRARPAARRALPAAADRERATVSRFVLDCSVTMAWCFESEADAYARAVLASMARDRALVPAVWLLEVSNVLLVAERRRWITRRDADRFLALLEELPVEVAAPDGVARRPSSARRAPQGRGNCLRRSRQSGSRRRSGRRGHAPVPRTRQSTPCTRR